MSVLFIFIDGVGVGENSKENPLTNEDLYSFSYFTKQKGLHKECTIHTSEDTLYKPIDANLGVEGLPQSGTGQTTLFTGVNASKVIDKHFGPYPHSKIKPFLANESIFNKALQIEKNPHFLNAYPDIFFTKSEKINRWSCTTYMTKSAGIPLNKLIDIQEERAVTAEITQSTWKSFLKLDVPVIEPEEASQRALDAMKQYDLVLYEYYLTDKVGHSQNRRKVDRILPALDRFIGYIINHMDTNDTLVITSDHGNIEDLSIKTHTRNPVPLFVKGNYTPFLEVESILDITPAIIKTLQEV